MTETLLRSSVVKYIVPKAIVLASARRMREKWPQKYRARAAVARALKKGTIQRQPCEKCGRLDVQAHHDDYDKPLEIRWLCKPHHTEADAAMAQSTAR